MIDFDEPPESFSEPAELAERDRGEAAFRFDAVRHESQRADWPKGDDVARQSTMSDAQYASLQREYDDLSGPLNETKRAWERLLDESIRLSSAIKVETQAREIDRLVAEAMADDVNFRIHGEAADRCDELRSTEDMPL